MLFCEELQQFPSQIPCGIPSYESWLPVELQAPLSERHRHMAFERFKIFQHDVPGMGGDMVLISRLSLDDKLFELK